MPIGPTAADLNSAWKQARGEPSFSSTSTLVTANARITRAVTLIGGYDGRRNVLLARDRETPETAFDRRWALAVLAEALERLRNAAGAAEKARHFELLHPFLSREPVDGEYAAVAEKLGISPGAVGVAVHRLRQRYRETLRTTVADTLADAGQVDDEMRHVFAALSS